MKLFNLDCHVSVIEDLKQIYEGLGHEVTSWSVSGHTWIFDRKQADVDIVNQNTWRNLSPEMCNAFYERYKDELSCYDGFICTYPPAFCMLYEKFNKPVILHIPIRYEVPFNNNHKMWEYLNDYLRKGIDSGMIIPVANSIYDKKYFEFFVKRDCKLIPSLCEYTKSDYNPPIRMTTQFLMYSRLNIALPSNIVNKDSLGKHEWQDIANYNGIIMLPYNCSIMSIFEYYTANIPLFAPTKEFMKTLYADGHNVLSELTWNKTNGLPPGSVIGCEEDKDPNRYDSIEIMSKWIDYCDFYNAEWMPYITYFESFEDLSVKLSTTNLNSISSKMKDFNISRKRKIYDLWKKELLKLEN